MFLFIFFFNWGFIYYVFFWLMFVDFCEVVLLCCVVVCMRIFGEQQIAFLW